jgi:phenylacetate-CoA ligase
VLAPPARIRRRTASQTALAGRLRATVADWRALAGVADESVARRDVEARLPILAARLLRSPFWIDRLRAAGLAVGELSLTSLALVPPIDRATLAALGDDLVGWNEGDDLVRVKSSGTSGAPVGVVKDRWDSLHMWAFLAFCLERWAVALPARPRVVLLDALPGGLEYSVRLRLVGDGGGALHRLSLARPDAERRLRRADPAVIFADPAGLHWLASRRGSCCPRLILTSASHFGAEQRTAFAGVPVVNYYATTETGPIAWECLLRGGAFHVLAPEIWLESVDGELLVSRLRDSALPLLRYATGDRGQVERDVCMCGFHGWTLTCFSGRSACLFRTPAGHEIDAWSLAWLFKQHDLGGFQLCQIEAQRFTLAVDRPSPALLDQLRQALVVLGWPAPRIDVVPAGPAALKPVPFRRL